MEGRPLEDVTLVERAVNGDIAAYEELVLRYEGIALRVAYIITGSHTDAEDAAQEAFVKAYYALPGFQEGSPFRPWVLAIVANEARNRVRSRQRRADTALRAVADRSSSDEAPSPEDALLSHERREVLLAALNQLSPEDRLVIALRYFEDLSEKEMAGSLGCRQGTVKSRLSRAMARLRLALPESLKEAGVHGRGGVAR